MSARNAVSLTMSPSRKSTARTVALSSRALNTCSGSSSSAPFGNVSRTALLSASPMQMFPSRDHTGTPIGRLTPADQQPAGALFSGRDGTRFLLFPSSGTASGSHTQMGFIVADAGAEVRDLKQRGVQFEEYDFPGFDQATSIAQIGEDRGAWFKDSEGNLLGILQQR